MGGFCAVNSGKSCKIVANRPSWKLVYAGYPKTGKGDDVPAPIVFTTLLKLDDYTKHQAELRNACATRVSLGLINGGMKLKTAFSITNPKLPYNNPKFKQGLGFITSAVGLKKWLSQANVFGEADEKWLNSPITLQILQKKINKRKGIYIMIPYDVDFFGATGHATLWIGDNVIGGHNYIDSAKEIYFWELR